MLQNVVTIIGGDWLTDNSPSEQSAITLADPTSNKWICQRHLFGDWEGWAKKKVNGICNVSRVI